MENQDRKIPEIEQNKSIDEELGTTYKSTTYRKPTGCGHIYISIIYKNDEPEKIELIRIQGCTKTNDCLNSNLESISDLLTFSIRRIRNIHEARAIVKSLKNHRCNRVIPNKDHITSCVDAVGRTLEEVLKTKEKETYKTT